MYKLTTLGINNSKSAPVKLVFAFNSGAKFIKAITTIPVINKYLGMNKIKLVKPLI